MNTQGFNEEAETMMDSTANWLRHTGISEDVKFVPGNTSETTLDTAPAPSPIDTSISN
ncbi:hypothetical protein [Granulosicoccus antarcticus]|uniref:hypothetical protein n=1 Tax=Granulosicoccus antarcticus TaxID=437505 RepID=UPI0012FD5CE8|nr:hypothetical protein [Granulosicoccus antarcticus]